MRRTWILIPLGARIRSVGPRRMHSLQEKEARALADVLRGGAEKGQIEWKVLPSYRVNWSWHVFEWDCGSIHYGSIEWRILSPTESIVPFVPLLFLYIRVIFFWWPNWFDRVCQNK